MGLSPSGFKKILTTFDVHFRKVSGFKVIKLSSINFVLVLKKCQSIQKTVQASSYNASTSA
jgi:hypothetical protein